MEARRETGAGLETVAAIGGGAGLVAGEKYLIAQW